MDTEKCWKNHVGCSGTATNTTTITSVTATLAATATVDNVLLTAAASRRRKKRTSIDAYIRVELERRFNLNTKPTSDEIAMVADELQMEKEVHSSSCILYTSDAADE